LISNGILFPQYSNWHQHSFAAHLSQKKDTNSLSDFMRSIFNETIDENCSATIISGEDFENFLIDTHLAFEFEMLAKSAGYSEIEWIVIQRDPIEYLLSIYSEKSGYGMVLDLGIMANSILKYGFFSASTSNYNYKFVFDINKFSEFFKRNVNPNLKVINFHKFINDFVGKAVLASFVDETSLKKLRLKSQNIGIKRKRPSKQKVELRYVANFLGMKPDKNFYESNTNLVDSLITHRLNRNKSLLSEIEIIFKEKFY